MNKGFSLPPKLFKINEIECVLSSSGTSIARDLIIDHLPPTIVFSLETGGLISIERLVSTCKLQSIVSVERL